MRSVADELRRGSARTEARLTPMERIALALWLGDNDAAQYSALHGRTVADARAILARTRTIGRLPSVANEPFSR